MTTKKKAQKGGRDKSRKAVRVDLDLAAVAEGYDRAARLVVGLFDKGASVPDWLTDLIMRGLKAATEKTGIEHWGATLDAGFDLRGIADLFAVTSPASFRLEFERKKDLPELISAVLRHPDTPANLYDAIGKAVDGWLIDETDPAYLRLAFANLAAVQMEVAEDGRAHLEELSAEKGGE